MNPELHQSVSTLHFLNFNIDFILLPRHEDVTHTGSSRVNLPRGGVQVNDDLSRSLQTLVSEKFKHSNTDLDRDYHGNG